MFVQDLVNRAAWQFGDAPAIVEGERSLTFTEFEERTNRFANSLLDLGLTPGDRVASVLPNCTEELISYIALARAGLHRVGLNARDSAEDQAFKIEDSEARGFISDGSVDLPVDVEFTIGKDEVWERSQSGRPDPVDVPLEPHDQYRLAYTGGTTGKPKGVILTLRTLQAQVTNYMLEHTPGIQPGDVMLHAAPVSHASGSYFLPHLLSGGVSVLLSRFRPGEFLEELERTQARRTFLVPTMIAALLEEPNVEDVDASRLVRLCYGASPIAPSVAEHAGRVFGEVLCQTFGQAEAPMCITLLKPDEHHRVGSAGRPYRTMRVRILDDEGNDVPRGETGEICTRGPSVAAGYWNRPEATAETFGTGWLHTGDIGYMDEDGYVYLLDRRNDMIISGGFNVYPREVEDALTSHPAVVEAAVVSLADDKWGEVVQAVVKCNRELATEELDEYMKTKVAGYKRPRGYYMWDELPKSGPGKIMRRTIRDRLRAQLTESHQLSEATK
jgi:acyl-CoA synthetase (AMP-forming)/AMP-acid ligase II